MTLKKKTAKEEILVAESLPPTENTEVQVVKSNKLILARYRMSLVEQKLFAGCLGKLAKINSGVNLTENQSPTLVITATTDELKHWIGRSDRGFHATLKTACANIMTRYMQVETPDDKNFAFYNIVSKAEYINGVLTMRLNDEIKDYVIGIQKGYTKYSIDNICSFRSAYSVRIYELLKKHAYLIPEDNTPFTLHPWSLDDFKILIGLIPIDSTNPETIRELSKRSPDMTKAVEKSRTPTYQWGDFKKRVLEPAKKELSEFSDISFDYNPIHSGKGRKVVGLQFTIWRNDKNGPINTDEVVISPTFSDYTMIRKICKNVQLTDFECSAIYDAAGGDIEKVEKAFKYTKDKEYSNFVAYLISVIKNCYYEQTTLYPAFNKNDFEMTSDTSLESMRSAAEAGREFEEKMRKLKNSETE